MVLSEIQIIEYTKMNGIETDYKTYSDVLTSDAESKQEAKRNQFESALAEHILAVWEKNKRAKLDVELRIIRSLRQRDGKYDPEKLALIRLTEGSEFFSMLTYIKCRAAEAWAGEAYSEIRNKSWYIKPTPIPDLPENVVKKIEEDVFGEIYTAAMYYQENTGNVITPQEFYNVQNKYQEEIKERIKRGKEKAAKMASERMTKKIEDQFEEGKWDSVFEEVRSDIITCGTGILKGPIIKNEEQTIRYQQSDGSWTVGHKLLPKVTFSRISPLDIYPEDAARDIQDGSLIERMLLSAREIYDMIGLPGFNNDNIKKAVKNYSRSSPLPQDQARAEVEGREGLFNDSDKLEVLNYWGEVRGDLLLEWGMDESQVPDVDNYYSINAWLVTGSNTVVMAKKNRMRIKPYSKACFERINGAFWGKSLPEIVSDDQDMCNSQARAIQNNTAMSCLPMSEIDIKKCVPGEVTNKLWGGRTFQTDTKGMNEGQAVRFYQPPTIVLQLMTIFEKFSRSMDEKSGIPAYAHGDPKVGGAGNSASGLSLFITMGGKVIKKLIEDIDRGIVLPTIERLYNHDMMYDEDESIKGDMKIAVRGVTALTIKEQEDQRKNELMRDTNNPTDLQILGLQGRKELLRGRIETITTLDADKIIPEDPIQFFPIEGAGGSAPSKKEPTRDVAGNLSGGVDVNQFKHVSQRGSV